MKWMLIIYFFVTGPGGGWREVDREYYINKQHCMAEQHNWSQTIYVQQAGYMTRCKEIDENT